MNESLTQRSEPPTQPRMSVGQCVTLACLLEVTAPKPGNVHRGADFADTTFADFIASAVAISPILDQGPLQPIGRLVLQSVRATAACVSSNTNLGLILLLAPLAHVAVGPLSRERVGQALSEMTSEDSADVYAAIAASQPGGLGRVETADVHESPPADLLHAMRLAADRDLIARQYENAFQDVFESVEPQLVAGRRRGWTLTESIVSTHVNLIGEFGDSLIARKCGVGVARQAQGLARQAIQAGGPRDPEWLAAVAELDFWLRADGNRRNPGATADLIGAGLFLGLWNGTIVPPYN